MNGNEEQLQQVDKTIRSLIGLGALCIGLAIFAGGLCLLLIAAESLAERERLLLATLLLPLLILTIWLVTNLAVKLQIVPSLCLSPNAEVSDARPEC